MGVTLLGQNEILKPGEKKDFFLNHVDPGKFRAFSAVPVEPPKGSPAYNFDAQVSVVKVVELLYGDQHNQGDLPNLQVNVTVQNLSTHEHGNVYCNIFMFEQ